MDTKKNTLKSKRLHFFSNITTQKGTHLLPLGRAEVGFLSFKSVAHHNGIFIAVKQIFIRYKGLPVKRESNISVKSGIILICINSLYVF